MTVPQMFTENNSDAFTAVNDENARHDLGTTARVYDSTYGWRTYAYYKVADAVNVTAGMVVCYSTTMGNVTPDISGGTSTGGAAGVALGSVTATYHGWFVVGKGDYVLVNTDGGVAAAGEFLVPHSVDGEVDTMADGEEEQVFAVATAADSSPGDQVVAVLL